MDFNTDEVIGLVRRWGEKKGLDKAEPAKQFLKVTEEIGEVAAALARDNQNALEDALGDTVVTLIILGQQQGMSLERCLATAYDEIKGRKGKTVNSVFIKEEDLNGEDN